MKPQGYMEDQNLPRLDMDLSSEDMHQELMVELTRAQVLIIYQFLEQSIQPRGLEMIRFTADLFDRLESALKQEEKDFLGDE